MSDKLTSFLTQKAGPLPVGVWIMAVGGGIGIAIYMRRNAAAADALPTDTDPTTDFEQGGNTFTPPGVGGSAGSNVTPIPTAPADNDEWLQRASDALVARGLSGSVVNAALNGFLSGAPWTEAARAIVDMAIRAVGNPPVAPPPAPNAPPPPPAGIPRTTPEMPQNNGPKPSVKIPGPPVRPRLVSQSVDAAGGRATVTVTHVSGATAYLWFVNGQQVNTTPTTTVTLTRLPRRTRITVSVIPQNAAGNGKQSAGLTFTTK